MIAMLFSIYYIDVRTLEHPQAVWIPELFELRFSSYVLDGESASYFRLLVLIFFFLFFQITVVKVETSNKVKTHVYMACG